MYILYLNLLGRGPLSRGRSALVVCARSVDESQRRSQNVSPWHCHMVYSRRCLWEMDIDWSSSMDPRPSYVNHLFFIFRMPNASCVVAGSGKTVLSCVPIQLLFFLVRLRYLP